MTTHSLTGSVN